MKRFSVLVTVLALLTTTCARILEVPGYGTIVGTEELSEVRNRPFAAFRSVYYAEQPTAETRFLPPVPKAPYPTNEVIDATTNNKGCNQALIEGSENCLTLDVFTPNLPTNGTLLPVMFWIHGGAFSLGQAVEYIPTRYMDHDIVLVVIQYRLGPLGFLSFDTDEVPGNAGIFDQIEALRWVNKNIRAFGGDPNQVTIAGESAGSASVTLLMLAPQAKGLFIRAIGESASVLASWGIDRDGRGKVASTRIAQIAGCPTTPYSAMLNCVRTIDAQTLADAYFTYSAEDMLAGGLGFSGSNPVIQVAGAQKIIDTAPELLFASGNYSAVPALFGANKQEGTLVLGLLYGSYLLPNGLIDNSTYLANDAVSDILKALYIPDPDNVLADQLTEKYFKGADMGNFTSMTPGFTDMCSVLFLKGPTYITAQYNAQHNPNTYWYSFNFEGRNSLFTYFFIKSDPPIPHGVCHADELIYLFKYPFPSVPPGLNATEQVVSQQMSQAWSNFVIYGNPTPDGVQLEPGVPKWPTYNANTEYYMAIDRNWEVRVDYTQTYTVTVDELKP